MRQFVSPAIALFLFASRPLLASDACSSILSDVNRSKQEVYTLAPPVSFGLGGHHLEITALANGLSYASVRDSEGRKVPFTNNLEITAFSTGNGDFHVSV